MPQGVLVLNRFWQAVHICSVRRAFSLLYLGHAQVVDGDGQDFRTFDFESWQEASQGYEGEDAYHTIRFRIRVPRVIVLMLFDRIPKKEVKLTRQNVFERDTFTCQYCGEKKERKDLNLDHVIPRDQGGTTTWENVVCSCIPCNTRKGEPPPPRGQHETRQKTQAPQAAHLPQRADFPQRPGNVAPFPGSGVLECRAERLNSTAETQRTPRDFGRGGARPYRILQPQTSGGPCSAGAGLWVATIPPRKRKFIPSRSE